eukprot:33725_1
MLVIRKKSTIVGLIILASLAVLLRSIIQHISINLTPKYLTTTNISTASINQIQHLKNNSLWNTNHINILSFKKQHFYDNNMQLPVPALIIAGPPKTGTSSLRQYLSTYPDMFPHPKNEHHFWTLTKKKSLLEKQPDFCEPILNESQWSDYLKHYQYGNQTLTALINIARHTNPKTKICNATKMEQQYVKGVRKVRSKMNKTCVHPLFGRGGKVDMNEYIEYCWFFEKSPDYAKTPYVSIFVANLLPKTRYLTILRNPIHQVWSSYFHVGGAGSNNWKTLGDQAREKYLFHAFDNMYSIGHLNGICNGIYRRYTEINNTVYGAKTKYLLMRNEYKLLIIEYFKCRYIDAKDRNLDIGLTRLIWATYYVPILFIGLFVNDEVFIGNKWNEWDPKNNEILNYKYIQFEWMWGNTLDSMRMLKCWITQGFRINNNQCEFQRDDVINKYLFNNLKKTNSRGKARFSDSYITGIKKIFTPCTQLVTDALLKDRPHILIGEWIEWPQWD